MDEFKATVQLPPELSKAITKAIEDSFCDVAGAFSYKQNFPMYMNKKQAAQYLGISYNTLMKWISNSPNFPYKEIDGVYRFNRNELDKFMASK